MAGRRLALATGPIAIAPMSGVIWVLFLFFFLGTIIREETTEQFSYLAIDRALIFFVILAFLSLLSSYYIGTPLDRSSMGYITAVIEPVFFYFLLRRVLSRKKRVNWLLFSIVLAMGIGSIMGFGFMLSIRGDLMAFLTGRGGGMGFGFRSSNLYGVAAALTFPLTLLFAVNSETRIQRIMSTGVMFMMFVAMATSFTRGIQIVLAIQVLILFLFYRSGRKYLYPILGLILMAVLIYRQQLFILFHRFFMEPLMPGAAGPLTSVGMRFEALRVSLISLGIYPFGLGGGNFYYIWEQFKPLHIIPMGTSHNLSLSIGTEFGVPAMIIFLTLFFLQFSMCWWIFKNSKVELHRDIAFIITVSYIGYCIYGMTTGVGLSHIIRYFPLTIMNSFTIILFALFAVVTTLFIEEKKKLLCLNNPQNLYQI